MKIKKHEKRFCQQSFLIDNNQTNGHINNSCSVKFATFLKQFIRINYFESNFFIFQQFSELHCLPHKRKAISIKCFRSYHFNVFSCTSLKQDLYQKKTFTVVMYVLFLENTVSFISNQQRNTIRCK